MIRTINRAKIGLQLYRISVVVGVIFQVKRKKQDLLGNIFIRPTLERDVTWGFGCKIPEISQEYKRS